MIEEKDITITLPIGIDPETPIYDGVDSNWYKAACAIKQLTASIELLEMRVQHLDATIRDLRKNYIPRKRRRR